MVVCQNRKHAWWSYWKILQILKENSNSRSYANQMLHRTLSLEFFILLQLRYAVLAKIERVQKRFPNHTVNLHKIFRLYTDFSRKTLIF